MAAVERVGKAVEVASVAVVAVAAMQAWAEGAALASVAAVAVQAPGREELAAAAVALDRIRASSLLPALGEMSSTSGWMLTWRPQLTMSSSSSQSSFCVAVG